MAKTRHNPRCAIFHEPPGLQDANDCNCGAIPALPACQHQWTIWVTDTHPEPHNKCLRCGAVEPIEKKGQNVD